MNSPFHLLAYSRAFSFRGSDGVEIMEPLSFKGRRGSGIAGGRCAYADRSLSPRWDWQKYEYGFRVWGRFLYSPETQPDVWQRTMRHAFGPAGPDLESALAHASRILPAVTTAHLPSAANNVYWPEVYLNHSLIDALHPGPYTDTPAPKVFGTVSPLDPQLFYRIDDFADALLDGERSGKYTPIDVAGWIEDHASAAVDALARADRQATGKHRPEYRRLTIDVAVAADLGRFFGAKFRAGVLYRIFDRTGDRGALEATLRAYRAARAAWADIVARTKGVYATDITVGEFRQLRGSWADRLADIDADIASIAARTDSARPAQVSGPIARAITEALGRPVRRAVSGRQETPRGFRPGGGVTLVFTADEDHASVTLHHRRVTQAERWRHAPMVSAGRAWTGTIPGEETQGPYALQYYFEVRDGPDSVRLFPGLGEHLIRQPYFVVRPEPKA